MSRHLFLHAIIGTALAAGACAGTSVHATASLESPEMVYVSPGVYAVPGYEDPIFYSNNYYWRYDQGYWYRSNRHTGGWRYDARPPRTVLRIDRPHDVYDRDRWRARRDYRDRGRPQVDYRDRSRGRVLVDRDRGRGIPVDRDRVVDRERSRGRVVPDRDRSRPRVDARERSRERVTPADRERRVDRRERARGTVRRDGDGDRPRVIRRDR